MATGGSEEDICALCLQTFENPKFLPCHHTFCARCIEDLAGRHSGAPFPCPACRMATSLPAGGVSHLQTNFYIKAAAPQKKPGAQDMCKKHPAKELEFYCVKCDEAICLNCSVTKHVQHEADDLTSAAAVKKKNLQADQQRLQNAMSSVIEGVTSLQKEKQFLDQKRAAVKKNIRNRHAIIVAAADQKMEEELNSLQSMYTDLDRDVDRAIEQREGDMADLLNLQQQLNNTITSGTASDVITVAKEMRRGRGSRTAIAALTSREERPFRRPVLHFNVSTDVMTQTTSNYLGRVHTMEMKETRREVEVRERFQCGEGPDVDVFALCHVDTDPPRVHVSYESCGMKKDAPRKSFTETGECVYTSTDDQVGKASYRRYTKGQCLYEPPEPGRFTTFCNSPSAAHLRLCNNLSGQADIQRVTVTSRDPFKSETKTQFTIQVGPHRAFDVDDTQKYFAVVEEAQESTARRTVRVYQRSAQTAFITYTPPTPNFLPSDVCFYTLGGQKVLLITDELNDSIHVVTINGERMTFERYLCGGCPSLIQPTAITCDINGRLWVACRGGAILTLEHIA